MDFTSRSIWDKQKRTNCYFYFALLPFFQSKMRTEHHITSAFSKPLIISLNFYCIGLFFFNFLLYCEILFFSFTSSMQVFLQPFNHSHWLSPAPSIYIVSVLILPVESSDSRKLHYWFALGHHWIGWSFWGIFYVVPVPLVRNKSPPWLQVSPMKLIPVKTLTLAKECVIFLLQLCKRKSTSSLDTSRKEIISQKNGNIFKDDLWAVFSLVNTQPWSPLESDFLFWSLLINALLS